MGLLDNMTNVINRGSAAAERTGKATRLKMRQGDLARQRTNLLAQLGAALYDELRTNEAIRAQHEELFGQIEALDAEQESVTVALAQIDSEAQAAREAAWYARQGAAGSARCPTCGTHVNWSDAFCPGCGTPLAGMQAAQYQSGRVCPACGAACEEGDRFCLSCGTRLPEPQQAEPQQAEPQQAEPQQVEPIYEEPVSYAVPDVVSAPSQGEPGEPIVIKAVPVVR